MSRRTKAQREKDITFIADKYLIGWTQDRIAQELGLNQSTISRDIEEVTARWRASALIDMNEAKAQELARIFKLESEYWDAWYASKGDEEASLTQKEGQTGGSGKVKTVQSKKNRLGDPRYLQGVERCIQMRIDLLGIQPPKQVNLGTPEDGLRVRFEWADTSDNSGHEHH